MPDLPESVTKLAESLAGSPGVVGVVLGGSRARGRNRPDSDIDLGLYYDKESFDWAAVTEILKASDDARSPRGLAPPGAWGPWMNGGAWLRIGGLAVDVLLRDAGFVEGIAHDAALLLRKLVGRDEVAHSAGLAHRCAMCMVHALFALNRTYLVNEKGAVSVAAGFEHVPPGFSARIDEALGPSELSRARRSELLSALVDEVEALVRAKMELMTTWDASSFPNA